MTNIRVYICVCGYDPNDIFNPSDVDTKCLYIS